MNRVNADTPPENTNKPVIKRRAVRAEVKDLFKLCAENDLAPKARTVLLVLYSYADRHGWAYPKISTIMEASGYADRQVRAAISSLVTAKLCGVIHPGRRKSDKRRVKMSGREAPPGVTVFFVCPIADAIGRRDFARHQCPEADFPDADERRWFVVTDNGTKGSYTADQIREFIRQGYITAGTNVMTDGSSKSFRAGHVAAFAHLFKQVA